MVILQIQRGPYNLRRGAVLFIPLARSTIYGNSSAQFRGSLIWNKWSNLVKFSMSISEFKNIIQKIGNIAVGVWYVEGSTVWPNFHVRLVLLCVPLDHIDTSYLTLYCSQLTGCYMISKGTENVEHLRYWLVWCVTFCVTLFATSLFALCEYFVVFVSWFLLVIS